MLLSRFGGMAVRVMNMTLGGVSVMCRLLVVIGCLTMMLRLLPLAWVFCLKEFAEGARFQPGRINAVMLRSY
jgi:hypothetical protein